jgi:uncharacterized protein YndB with AHSA1/START domain
MGRFEVSTLINAQPSKVWGVLTKPELIKRYMWGPDIVTDWKPGSPITWTGLLAGKPYENKGTVLNFSPEELLEYTYWSSISELEDIPENYAKITCRLSKEDGGTRLTIIMQDEDLPVATRKHLEWGWKMISLSLKRFVENH